MKFLTRPEHFSRLLVLIVLVASAASCNQDEEPGAIRVTAAFSDPTLTLAENEEEKNITLTFNRPVPTDGEIILKATAIESTCFSTSPVAQLGQIKLAVSRGDQNVSFKMKPTDNENLDGSKLVKFTIQSMSELFVAGSATEVLVTVSDDEAPVSGNFELKESRHRENVVAGTIEIALEHPAPADGVFVLNLQTDLIYGVDYATEPAAAGGHIFLPVSRGSNSAVIGFYAVNDQVFKGDRDIEFNIVDATGGVAVGPDHSFSLIITDDDGNLLSSISEIRQMYDGQPVSFNEDFYIEAYVTSVDNVAGGRIVIEDESGALPIQLTSDDAPTRGDLILLNIKHGLLRELQSTLEIAQVSSFVKVGEDAIRVTQLTLDELIASKNDRMESRTVQLTGVTFTQANGVIKLGGDRTLSDGNHSIIVRTGIDVDFADELVPEGTVAVTGIVANYNGQYVIYPQQAKDIKKQGNMDIKKPWGLPKR